jgi:peroxiredoxin Q/BCP
VIAVNAALRLLLLLTVVGFGASAAGTSPTVGSPAPAFSLRDQTGATHTLAGYAGKWLVVYFYPKDGTPGCTKQVCAYRDSIDKVRAAGAQVLGVSVDDVESHKKFAEEHQVPFPLLADVDRKMAAAYGVLTSKLGTSYARRDTFVIDPQGRIAKHYPNVDPEKNVAQVVADLALLTGAGGGAP